MPFAFIIVGIILTISGVKGTSKQLITLVQGDIQGKNGYLYWMVSILLIGSLGYIPAIKPFSRAFLVLVLIVLVLKTGNSQGSGQGFFQQFTAALQQIAQPTTSTTSTASTTSTTSTAASLGNAIGGLTF